MSGGHFDYNQYRIEDIAREVDSLIENNNDQTLNDWGEKIGRDYPEEILEKFREASNTLKRAAAMVQRIDYLVSDDDGPEQFLTRWGKEVPAIYQPAKSA